MSSIYQSGPCETCGAALIQTSGIFECCPNGHGGLKTISMFDKRCKPAQYERESARIAEAFAKAYKRWLKIAAKQV